MVGRREGGLLLLKAAAAAALLAAEAGVAKEGVAAAAAAALGGCGRKRLSCANRKRLSNFNQPPHTTRLHQRTEGKKAVTCVQHVTL
jgi:hypothetical protein